MPDSLFERTIKQTLRFLMIDDKLLETLYKGQVSKTKTVSETNSATIHEHIHSASFLKEFYNKPNHSVDLLLKTENQGLTEMQHIQKNTDIDFTSIQKDIILNFIKDINNHKPTSIQNWIALHHYIYYFYRRFVTVQPSSEKDDISDCMIKRIRYLLEGLLNRDPTQLYIKVFSTIRDFVIAARICLEEIQVDFKNEPLQYLSTFLTYYNALCAAAQKLTAAIPEFDRLLSFYNFNWLRFNKILFYTYFFKSMTIQKKLNEVEKSQLNRTVNYEKVCESYGLFLDDMNQTNSAWLTQTLRIETISKNLNSEDFKNDLNVCDSEASLLYLNYWLPRSCEQRNYEVNLNRFVGYLLSWMGKITNMAPSLIDNKGRCQCEECTVEHFIKCGTNKELASTFARHIKCDLCRTDCALESFATHLNNYHPENNVHSLKWHLNTKEMSNQTPSVRNVSPKVCKVLSDTIDDLKVNCAYFKKAAEGSQKIKIADGADLVVQSVPNPDTSYDCVLKDPVFSRDCQVTESIIKIASEPPLFKDSPVMDKSSATNCHSGSYKMSFQEFIKEKCDETTESCLRFDSFLKSADEAIKSDMSMKRDVKEKSKKSDIGITNNTNIKKCMRNAPDEAEEKDMIKTKPLNSEKLCNTSSKTANSTNHMSNHNCKHEDLNHATEPKKTCHSTCDHHKEARKCDCTYCEVFGTTMATHFYKVNETRDRLRFRLTQRKEKNGENSRNSISKVTNPSPYPNLNKPNPNPNLNKPNPNPVVSGPVKATVSKVPASTKSSSTKPNNSIPLDRVPNMSSFITPPDKPASKIPVVATNKVETSSSQPSVSSLSTSSLNSLCKDSNSDSRDINDLLNYIEGTKNLDKIALAEKKAAKKARQKLKKEQERLRIEREEREKEEQRIREQKRLEEEQLRAEALAKQFVEKLKKNKKNSTVDSKLQCQKRGHNKSKKNKNNKNAADKTNKHLIEETIPAMVTIKRIIENNSPPTVTITLKGSTPDQDKLLYTLVNGHTKETSENNNASVKRNKTNLNNSSNKTQNSSDNKESNKKSKKKKEKEEILETRKELKVTLSVDQICTKIDSSKKVNNSNNKSKVTENIKNTQKRNEKLTSKSSSKDVGLNIPMLRLPPGITITKVDGPISKNCKTSCNDNLNQNTNMPVSKSGVIVVDTEKLIQNNSTAALATTSSKKGKKKKNLKNELAEDSNKLKKNCSMASMVTLKNPIFHTLQTTLASKTHDKLIPEISNVMPCNQQASIIKNENGMVTIRSPRLQHSLTSGAVIPNLLTELKPVIGPEVSTPYLQTCHSNFAEKNVVSQFNAQEILSGLPGIEITKVEKRVAKDDAEIKKSCQAADVSIIPSNGGDKFNFDKDDWHYESVFAPKDILEDDLDAEERELEAFKRFCQQSVPPKRKEKVAHLNVKDIVLKKKNDYTLN